MGEKILCPNIYFALTYVARMLSWASMIATYRHGAEVSMPIAQIMGSASALVFLYLLEASAPVTTPKMPVAMVIAPNIQLEEKGGNIYIYI